MCPPSCSSQTYPSFHMSYQWRPSGHEVSPIDPGCKHFLVNSTESVKYYLSTLSGTEGQPYYSCTWPHGCKMGFYDWNQATEHVRDHLQASNFKCAW
ncbi:hypothetical protein M422DRAFT_270831 [Sphaerobolus stellatus SS14]|uniref:Uncharacterized protein n=1 Tax=Sphaerobolus stellatus (strain SS14) TaxID=990650 RepID=A0A0C9URZ8_SPHS4|nr:hypothetical protein M422DRAFT_270831 [Sphaerobolus stellatus SS14]